MTTTINQINEQGKKYLDIAMYWIATHPKRFSIDSWFDSGTNSCGTTACIGGYISLAAGMPSMKFVRAAVIQRRLRSLKDEYAKEALSNLIDDLSDESFEPDSIAVALLGESIRPVFFILKWPQEYIDAYYNAKDGGNQDGVVEAAIGAVNHFLDTDYTLKGLRAMKNMPRVRYAKMEHEEKHMQH